MGESSAGLLIIWGFVVLVGHVSGGNIHFLRAQCYSYCWTQHVGIINNTTQEHVGEGGNKRNDPLIKECNENQECRWCLRVCDRRNSDQYSNQQHCQISCQYFYGRSNEKVENANDSCNKTCGFIHRADKIKTGACPGSRRTVRELPLNCHTNCHTDSDCGVNKKCCSIDCGATCQTPIDNDILPLKPIKLSIKEKKSNRVVVTWLPRDNEDKREKIVPEFYLVQYRLKKHRQNFITSRNKYMVVLPHDRYYTGAVYKFRVAAINIHGSRGFSDTQSYEQPIHKPEKPVNLIIERTEFSDGKVSLTMAWQPPRSSSVHYPPITKFLIEWVKQPELSPIYERWNFSRKVVPSDINRCILPNLEPGSLYIIYVKALVKSNDNRIVGKPAFLHVRTDFQPEPFNPDSGSKWKQQGYSDIENVSVSESYVDDNVIKASLTWQTTVSAMKYMIYWKADNCKQSSYPSHFQEKSATSHSPEFNLFNLHYGCDYLVRILTVNHKGETGPAAYASFKTPPCTEIQVKGQDEHTCPVDDGEDLEPPKGMEIEIQGEGCDKLSVAINWQSEWNGDKRYMVKWGESRNTTNQIIYTSQLHKIILSRNVGKVILYDVQYSQHYTVQLSVVSLYGDGKPVIRSFDTPRETCPSTSTTSTKSSSSSTTQSTTSSANQVDKVTQGGVLQPVNSGQTTNNINCMIIHVLYSILILSYINFY